MGIMQVCRSLAAALLAAGLGVCGLPAAAQPVGAKVGGAIFTCTNAAGRKLTADRPIAECLDREQRVLNRDGSLRTVLPPSLTSDERAAMEDTERRRTLERVARQDAIRRDRNLLMRYPDEPAHGKARDAALDTVQESIRSLEQRVAELDKERKPLLAETEFYQGKALPAKLKSRIESIDVSLEAQRALVVNQQAELGRITALFDAELARLRRLWNGAEPGSLGPLPQSALAGAGAPVTPVKRP